MEPNASIIVVSNTDGKKYKMMLKGDMSLLTAGKIKRYLHAATGLEPSQQLLRFNNQLVADGMTGSDIGLYDGAVMFLDILPHPAPHSHGGSHYSSVPSPHHGTGAAAYPHISPSQQGYGSHGYGSIAPQGNTASPSLDIERIRAEERQKLETELRLKELQERELLREAERLRSQERERLVREQEDQQRMREHERLLERERLLEVERKELEARQRAIEEAKQRDIEELRQQQRQLAQDRQRLEAERSAPSPHEEVIRQQQLEIERLRSDRSMHRRLPEDNVTASLAALSRELQIPPLQLDGNRTCAVTLDDGKFNMLLTFDPATQRLYMYATILNSLPADPTLRLQLYELLLEGALLGRDMCGGGVGVSTKNSVVLMSTSLDMEYSDPEALAAMARPFLEGLRKWNTAVESLLNGDNPHHRRVPTMQGNGRSSGSSSGSPHRNPSPPRHAVHDAPAGGYATRHAASQQYHGAGTSLRF